MNRGPIILTIEEAEYILDQFPLPSDDEEPITTNLRRRFKELLEHLRAGAEGSADKSS